MPPKNGVPPLKPGPRCQDLAFHLESLKSLNIESLRVIIIVIIVIIYKLIITSWMCHSHMKDRLKHIGKNARSRTKFWRHWLHVLINKHHCFNSKCVPLTKYSSQLHWYMFRAFHSITESLALRREGLVFSEISMTGQLMIATIWKCCWMTAWKVHGSISLQPWLTGRIRSLK